MADARVLVEIQASSAQFQAEFNKASQIAQTNAQKIEGALNQVGTRALSIGRNLLTGFAAGFGFVGVAAAIGQIKENTAEADRSLAQLRTALETTGGAAGLTFSRLEKLNEEIQKKTVFDDGAIREATTALLRFRTVQADVFQEALKLAPDLAAALGTTLPDAAVRLGRAFEDPERGLRGLREAGLRLSQEQIDLAARFNEAGNKAGAQRLILDALRKSVGGASEADTQGLYGATKLAHRAWDDFTKALGHRFLDDQVMRGLTDQLNSAAALIDKVQQGTRERSGKITQLGAKPQTDEELAAEKAAAAKVLELNNKAYEDYKAILKARAAAGAEFYAAELQVTRAAIALQQDQLEFGYREGLVSTEEFYAERKKIIAQDLDAGTEAINKQIEDLQRLRDSGTVNRDENLAAFNKQNALVNQANALRNNAAKELQNLDQRQLVDVRNLNDEYDRLRQNLLSLQGDVVGAAKLGFDVSNRDLSRRLQAQAASPDQAVATRALAAQADLDATRERIIQQAKLNQANTDFGLILDQVSVAQTRVGLAFSTGSITELESLAKLSEVNRSRIKDLTAIAEAYQKIAEETKDPKALVAAEQLRLRIEELSAATDLVADKFRKTFVDDAVSALDEFVSGTKSAKDAFSDFARSVAKDITHIANQQIAESIFGKSGVGGGIAPFLASLFAGGASSYSGAYTSAVVGISGLAGGTDNWRGGEAWVGERGIEKVYMPKGSRVVPNSKLDRGGLTLVQNINVMPGASRATANQAALASAREASRAVYRDG